MTQPAGTGGGEAGAVLDRALQQRFDEMVAARPPQDWYHRFEIVEGSGVFTPGHTYQDYSNRMRFLERERTFFAGKRMIDIGAYSGAFTFFLEDSGADVTAVDVYDPDQNGFSIVQEIRDSSVEHRIASVYDLDRAEFGVFDIVAFYGVFYHLKHPLLAFERINTLLDEGGLLIGGGTGSERWFHDADESCRRGVDFEEVTAERIGDPRVLSVPNLNRLPLCGFASEQLFRDRSNWFVPNAKCLRGWLEVSGFEVDKLRTFTAPIIRDWNRDQVVQRSAHAFIARKVGDPRQEYVNPRMKPYRIPREVEVERLRADLRAAEAELAELRGGSSP